MSDEAERAETEQPGLSPSEREAYSEQSRRGFFTRFLAVVIGGFVGLFPALIGVVFFLDPLRKRKSRKSLSGIEKDPDGFLKIVSRDALLKGGVPRRYAVIDELSDAWNLYPAEPIGAVYLARTDEDEVLALNASCPHAGCPVGFDRDRDVFQCPCHDSSFEKSGEIHSEKSPSPRGLDPLEVKIKNENEVWVKFQNFRTATAERVVEE